MTANLLLRRDTFNAIDGFDEQFDVPFREDTDLGWRACALGEIPFGHDVRVFHPAHARSVEREALSERVQVLRKGCVAVQEAPGSLPDAVPERRPLPEHQGVPRAFPAGRAEVRRQDRRVPVHVVGRGVPRDDAHRHNTRSTCSWSGFRTLLESYRPANPDDAVNPADAFFLYRLLLGRNPDTAVELPGLLSDRRTFRELRQSVLDSDEFAGNGTFTPPHRLWMAELEEFRFWFNTSDREMGVVMAMGRYEPEMRPLRQAGASAGHAMSRRGGSDRFLHLPDRVARRRDGDGLCVRAHARELPAAAEERRRERIRRARARLSAGLFERGVAAGSVASRTACSSRERSMAVRGCR